MKLKVLELSKRSLELSVAVLFVMSIAVFGLPVSVSAFEDGDGTEETPYRIGDCQQLQDMQDDLDAYYVLANDIDCSETTEWNSGDGFVPVGDNANPFLGELDGDYHTISNLHINRDDWEVGLFGRVGQWDNQVGLVTKVGMEDVDITGDWSTGGIVGVLYGQVNTSYTTGEVNGSGETGGLVGSHGGVWDTVIDSWSSADVTGGELVGGLVGYNEENSNIINSYATGTVQGTGSRIGGAVGYNRGNITNVHATGNVWGQSDNVGGLVGQNGSNGLVNKSYATGYVQGGYSNTGGLVGYNNGTIEKSYSNNTASGDESVGVYGYCIAGGLVGAATDNSNITNSFSRSSSEDVECISGGLIGVNEGSMTWAYGTGASDDGSGPGLVGDNGADGQVWSSFWDQQTTGASVGCAYGVFDCTASNRAMSRTTTQMKTVENYADPDLGEGMWDFESTWYIDPDVNDGYPFFINGDVGAHLPEWGESEPDELGQDLNGDSIPDSEQPYVTAFVSGFTNKQIVLELGEDCEASTITMRQEVQLAMADSAYDYANGFTGFTADCGEDGYTTIVRLFYYDVTKDNLTVRKYNPNNNSYFNLSGQYGATLEQTTIGGHTVTVASYQITDGGELDMDGTVNGTIVDPVGLGSQAISAPNTGLNREQ